MNAPYATKILKKTGNSVMAYQSTWLVEETFSCNELIIRPRAVLMAPEGNVSDADCGRRRPEDRTRHLQGGMSFSPSPTPTICVPAD